LLGGLVIGAMPARADVVFSDNTFDPGNYDATSTYLENSNVSITASQCASCGDPGSALQFAATSVDTSGATLNMWLGLVNTTFAYDPLTQGAIASLSASVDLNAMTNIFGTFTTGFELLIQQDGIYYRYSTSGPTFTAGAGGGSSGYSTVSTSDLSAANFVEINFATGTTDTSSHPDFDGDPMLFGIVDQIHLSRPYTFTEDYDNLSIDIQSVPEPASLALYCMGLIALAMVDPRAIRRWSQLS